MAKKIPSRKFPTGKKKIPSRKFPKSKKKVAKTASKPEPPALPERPANEEARQDRIKTLKEKLKSLDKSK